MTHAKAPPFSQRLRSLRESRGWTQQQLAAAADLHQSTVSRLEDGTQRPSLLTAEALARALGPDSLAHLLA